MQDIKDIATMMGEQFATAVKLAERSEAEELESVFKSLEQSWQIYLDKSKAIAIEREKIFFQLDKNYLEDGEALGIYQNELHKGMETLKHLRNAKLGANNAVSKKAEVNGINLDKGGLEI